MQLMQMKTRFALSSLVLGGMLALAGCPSEEPGPEPEPTVNPEPDAGPETDGGNEPDAGPETDGGNEPDAGPETDGGNEPDAGPETDAGNPDDAGNPGDDAGNPGDDAGNPGDDAGNPGDDAGNPGDDAGNPGDDAGNPGDDAGNPGDDAGNPGDDAGTPDGGVVMPGAPTISSVTAGAVIAIDADCGDTPSVSFTVVGTTDADILQFWLAGAPLGPDPVNFVFDDVALMGNDYTGTVKFCVNPNVVSGEALDWRVEDVQNRLSNVYAYNEAFYTPGCPNDIVDDNETCDDGAQAPGDGCDANCQLEIDVSTCEAVAPVALPYSGTINTTGAADEFDEACGGQFTGALGSESYVPFMVPGNTIAVIDVDGDVDFGAAIGESCIETIGVDCFDGQGGGSGSPVRLAFLNNQPQPVPLLLMIDIFNDGEVGTFNVNIETRVPDTCGNGFIEGGEQCDDDNNDNGDGCDEFCNVELDPVCTMATPIDTFPSTVSGDTTGGVSAFDTTCGNQSTGADTAYTVTVPPDNYLTGDLDASFDSTIALLAPCLPDACIDFDDGFARIERVGFFNDTPDPIDVTIVVGGYDIDEEGTFDLTVDVFGVGCGNGIPEGMEACDDGNLDNGDGCDEFCNIEINPACTMAPVLDMFPATLQGDTTGASNIFDDTCGNPSPGNDVLYAVNVPDGTYLRAELLAAHDAALAFLSPCSPDTCIDYQSLGFSDEEILYFNDTGAEQLVHILVGGDENGTYDLNVDAFGVGCGNGIPEGMEECDDGNLDNGDGCDEFCAVEPPPDVCAAPEAINGPYPVTVSGDTTGQRPTFTNVCGGTSNGADYAYVVNVPTGATLTASIPTADYDVVVNLLAACDPSSTCFARNDSGGGSGGDSATYTNDSGADLDVYVIISGYYSEASSNAHNGTYDLEVDVVAPECGNGIVDGMDQCDDGNPDDGDGCSSTCQIEACLAAPMVLAANTPVTEVFSPSEEPNLIDHSCGSSFSNNNDHLIVFQAEVDGSVTLTTQTGDSVMEAFDGCVGASIVCQDDPNELTFNVVGGNVYTVAFEWYSSSNTSEATVDIVLTPAP